MNFTRKQTEALKESKRGSSLSIGASGPHWQSSLPSLEPWDELELATSLASHGWLSFVPHRAAEAVYPTLPSDSRHPTKEDRAVRLGAFHTHAHQPDTPGKVPPDVCCVRETLMEARLALFCAFPGSHLHLGLLRLDGELVEGRNLVPTASRLEGYAASSLAQRQCQQTFEILIQLKGLGWAGTATPGLCSCPPLHTLLSSQSRNAMSYYITLQ